VATENGSENNVKVCIRIMHSRHDIKPIWSKQHTRILMRKPHPEIQFSIFKNEYKNMDNTRMRPRKPRTWTVQVLLTAR
jgi:hypothetical protein